MQFEEVQLLLVSNHATIKNDEYEEKCPSELFNSFNRRVLTNGMFRYIWETNCLILIWLHVYVSFLANVDQSN